MDEIATLAAVSKQTVYKHFSDKDRLFSEIIVADIEQAEAESDEILASLSTGDDVARDLRRLAREMVTTVLQPHIVRLRRIIIGAADRFPELARKWYERGPERSYATLAERFADLAKRGLLRVDDPTVAAQHFTWLVLSVPLNRAMFYADGEALDPTELQRHADEGVRVFLAAYAPADPGKSASRSHART